MSNLRKIKTISGTTRKCEVMFDKDWEEYRVKLFVGGVHQKDADYHTGDQDDAIATARTMAAEPETQDTIAGSGWVERVKPGRINNPKAYRA